MRRRSRFLGESSGGATAWLRIVYALDFMIDLFIQLPIDFQHTVFKPNDVCAQPVNHHN